MRKKGDTHGALMTLKELDMLIPNNPRIMHEIAVTYDLMQLGDKANMFWERVYAMGESGAGDYYALADMQLNTKEIDGELIPDGQYVLNVGDIVAKRDPSGVGERIYIRVPINSLPNTAVDPSKVTVNIQFFDLIDGNRIEKTTNRTDIRWRWTSIPIDWKEQAPENWDVTYFRDDSAPGIEPISGGRRYYGYIVRLYYNNELQDVIANPRTLIDFRPEKVEEAPPILDNSLFPSR